MRAIFIYFARVFLFLGNFLKIQRMSRFLYALYETLLNYYGQDLPQSVNRVCKQLSWWFNFWTDHRGGLISDAVDSLQICDKDFRYLPWNAKETVVRVTELFRLRDEYYLTLSVELLLLLVLFLLLLLVIFIVTNCSCRKKQAGPRVAREDNNLDDRPNGGAVAPPPPYE